MTYFQVLGVFILPPLLILAVVVPRDLWRWLRDRSSPVDWLPYLVILAHVVMALVYTTPWDNYLVATNVWWYDPALVTGVTIGWVPIEEYTFFILQTLLTGLWTLGLMRSITPQARQLSGGRHLRLWAGLGVAALWLVSTAVLISGWKPGTYLTLILSWALVPVFIQVVFGADILWANRKLLALAILPPTLYLWWVDSLALTDGTWVIDPVQTTGLAVGVIPLEEMVFFAMTNTIIGFGVTLMLSPIAQARAQEWQQRWRQQRSRSAPAGLDRRQLTWAASVLLWLAALIATPLALWGTGQAAFAGLATIGVLAQFAVVLGALTIGWQAQRTTAALVIVLVGSWLVEAVGVAAGVPFGHYHYTGELQPQLADVPLLIPMAWFMMLPPAWAVAEMILSRQRLLLGRLYRPVFATLAAMAFTAWDLYLDPQMTARGLWIWETPGAYFGIPLANFAGWWLTAFALTWMVNPRDLPHRPLYLVYVLTWVFQAVGLGIFWGQPGPALVGFLGMGSFAAWAWLAEGRTWLLSSGRRRVFSRDPSRSL